MIQRQPSQVVITTPKGTGLGAHRLYDWLETRVQPGDMGLLRDYDWWRQLNELTSGNQIAGQVQQRRGAR